MESRFEDNVRSDNYNMIRNMGGGFKSPEMSSPLSRNSIKKKSQTTENSAAKSKFRSKLVADFEGASEFRKMKPD